MSRLVFLVEEPSAAVLIEGLLPRMFPDLVLGTDFVCLRHEGKHDFQRSIPRKLRAWREAGARFVLLRDNDSGDCVGLKASMRAICEEGKRPDALIRIACQELEAWYLGDPEALARAFGDPRLAGIGARAAFRDPDLVAKPSERILDLIPSFQKISGARAMAQELSRDRNSSRSFRAFVDGVERQIKQFHRAGGRDPRNGDR